jgi:hypothetical protein
MINVKNNTMKKLLIIPVLLPVLFCSCKKSPANIAPPVTPPGVVTFAGNGTAGYKDGTGTAVEFNLPIDIVNDPAGNVYVADQGNNVIRKIALGGIVSTYAGNGTAGYKDGAALSAEFNAPEGMVIDDAGNLYVSDSQNNVIREITPNGTVSTYAGNGTQGLQNGSALTAEFAAPNGLAIDKSRNIYVADFLNNVIRKITSGGAVTTYAGNGSPGLQNGAAASAEFRTPSGLAADLAGNVYVAEAGNKVIRMITTGGTVSTFASNFSGPIRITADVSGNLYVSDSNNTIRKVTSAGVVTTYAGDGTPGLVNGPLLSAEFNTPSGVFIDSFGNLFIADYGNAVIRGIAP